MELFHAHRQWANRPVDERFTNLRSLFDATVSYAEAAVEKPNVRPSAPRNSPLSSNAA